jgi:TonB-dependent Receptor Plug Domain
VRLNEFFAISFLRKLPRPCEEVKIFGRSLILDPLKGAIVFACLFAVGPSVFAQDDPSAPGSDSLSRIIVQGIAPEHNVLPNATDLSDVLGFDLPVNEVPRSISVITKEELENANVRTARDLARISADTYTPYFNGNPSSTYIRGQLADTFFNGMRIGLTSEGVRAPIDFNAVESVNIVKGPAPAVYGPSQNVGGFIDLIAKQPYSDRFHAEIDATFGEYEAFLIICSTPISTINLISAWDSVLALKLLVRLTSLMADRSRYRRNLHSTQASFTSGKIAKSDSIF